MKINSFFGFLVLLIGFDVCAGKIPPVVSPPDSFSISLTIDRTTVVFLSCVAGFAGCFVGVKQLSKYLKQRMPASPVSGQADAEAPVSGQADAEATLFLSPGQHAESPDAAALAVQVKNIRTDLPNLDAKIDNVDKRSELRYGVLTAAVSYLVPKQDFVLMQEIVEKHIKVQQTLLSVLSQVIPPGNSLLFDVVAGTEKDLQTISSTLQQLSCEQSDYYAGDEHSDAGPSQRPRKKIDEHSDAGSLAAEEKDEEHSDAGSLAADSDDSTRDPFYLINQKNLVLYFPRSDGALDPAAKS